MTRKFNDTRDEALWELTRLSGILGAAHYLMGGHERYLEGDLHDFELAIGDIQERVAHITELVSGLVPGGA